MLESMESAPVFQMVGFLPSLRSLDRGESASALQLVWFDGDRHWLLSHRKLAQSVVFGDAMRDPVSDWDPVDLLLWLLLKSSACSRGKLVVDSSKWTEKMVTSRLLDPEQTSALSVCLALLQLQSLCWCPCSLSTSLSSEEDCAKEDVLLDWVLSS